LPSFTVVDAARLRWLIADEAWPIFDVRRAKALSFSGCESRAATFAPAGSN